MIFTPDQWEKPTSKEMLDFIEGRKGSGEASAGGALVFRRHLSPLAVYKYLYACFGPPYGFQTRVKKPNDSDNLIHWDYLVKAGSHFIYFQGGNRDIHVYIFGKLMLPEDWVHFTKAMKDDFRRVGGDMNRVGQTLEKWIIVANRYSLIADACAGFHELLTDEQGLPDFTPHTRSDEAGIRAYYEQVEEIRRRGNRVFSASLSLDLITPVLAEAFVNLLIFLLRKSELQNNSRQYDDYIRQKIDTRVFDLHLKCDHFVSGVDPNHDAYKAFAKVMARRNQTLHGNIDPQKDTIETVYFDGYTPLFEMGADPVLEHLRKQETVFDVTGTLERYHAVHAFCYYLLQLIDQKARPAVERFVEQSTFGYDPARKKPGQLFPAHEVAMIAPMTFDDELDVDWR